MLEVEEVNNPLVERPADIWALGTLVRPDAFIE
jgi:hypothetical protein